MQVDLKKIIFSPITIEDMTYFEDENGKVYATATDNNYGAQIFNLTDDEVVENPNIYQTMYGLLNFLNIENSTNPQKQGHYRMTIEDLYFSFKEDMNLIKYGKIYSAEQLQEAWAIDGGEIKVGAFNSVAKDIIDSMPKIKQEELSM